MIKLKEEKLHVNYMNGVDSKAPIIPRLYTLTHSDETGELFLYIGLKFAYNKISPLRDEVLAEWTKIGNKYVLKVDLHIDPPIDGQDPRARDIIFRKELRLALEAIVCGDKDFFYENPILEDSPIIIYFNSKLEEFNKVECYGTIKDYMYRKRYYDNLREKEKEEDKILDFKDDLIITLLLPYIERAMYYEKKVKEKYIRDNIDIMTVDEVNGIDEVKDYNVKVRVFNKYKNNSKYEITFLIKQSRIEIKKVEKL